MIYISIDLDDIFAVDKVLKSRGFDVLKVGKPDELILKGMQLPKNSVGLRDRNDDTELVYRIFNNTKLRNELLKFLNNRHQGSLSPELLQLTKKENFQKNRQSFSKTFEWYVGELMVREFSAMASQFGVVVDNISRSSAAKNTPGDFDVITILRDLGIAYFECKTGRFGKDNIVKAVERSLALHCEFVIMFIDDHFRKDVLTQSLKGVSYPLTKYNSLKEISINDIKTSVYSWMNCYFITTDSDIHAQLKIVLRVNSAMKIINHLSSGDNPDTYQKLGYQISIIFENWC